MAFFQKTILEKYQAMLPKEQISEAWQKFQAHFFNPETQEILRSIKEEEYQSGFLQDLFVNVLSYKLKPAKGFNLTREKKNETDAKKADGAIWLNGKVIGVIELKDHKTTDLKKVETQAFQYKSQNKDARYVIISNFEKLRLYIDNATEHREWNLFTLTETDFEELYCCLAWTQVQKKIAIQMKESSVSVEKDVTDALYRSYSLFKRELFEDILMNNPVQTGAEKEWQLLLYKKTQKLLDRLLFIFFAEDGGLLPPNSMVQILNQWQQLKDLDEDIPLYNRIKKYFGYLDKGNPKNGIFAYNGGLFRVDEVLDSLIISDELLYKHTKILSEYDFKSDVDVNILGHIFEHSLSEIEEVTQRIMGVEVDSSKSKRKKDGVFYTPSYITKYIVENTVGKLCAEKKQTLDIKEEEYFSDRKRQKQTKLHLLEQLKAYREWLLQITILDPACGSGAFLNAALSFLMDEHRLIDEMEAKVAGSTIVFQDIENSILENNLFGVDINEESVEIAQLALWLRTAKPQRKLSSLSENIKCGNSLISDPAIAGNKAFDWKKEFPQVFEKGGFDVVIGNPPYVEAVETEKEYYKTNYPAVEGHIDLFEIFIQKGVTLLRDKGYFAFINPNTVLSNLYSKKLREMMVCEYGLCEVINFGMDVFQDPTVHTCILIMRKGVQFETINIKQKVKSQDEINAPFDYSISTMDIKNSLNFTFDLTLNNIEREIFNKLKILPTLGEYCYLRQCIKTGDDNKYVRKSSEPLTEPWKKTLRGKGMCRYSIIEDDVYLKYGDWLARNWKNKTFYECNKIAVRETGDRINACLDTNCRYLLSSLYSIYPKDDYTLDALKALLAILNSNFATYYIRKIAFDLTEGAFTKVRTNQLARLPLPDGIISNSELIDRFTAYTDNMLVLNEELHFKRKRFLRRLKDNFEEIKITGALSTFDQMGFADFLKELKKQKITLKLIQQDEWEEYFNNYRSACRQLSEQIAETDKEIDLRVYKLYGLTYDEVLIVDADFGISREEYNKF